MAFLFLARVTDGSDTSALEAVSDGLPSLENTYGAYLVGTFVGLMLYGLSIHQTYNYARLFPNDTLFIRLLVTVVMILETLHAVFTMHSCYYYLTSNYANPAALEMGVWSLNWIPILVGINMFISQLFFARRVYLMGKHYRIIVCIAAIFFVVEIGFSIASVREVIAIATLQSISKVNHLLAATFAAAVIGDTLLSSSLLTVLLQSRFSEYRRNEHWIETLTQYTVNTGILHDLLNVVSLIIVLTLPNDLLHASVSIVTTRLYANTLLAVLNGRKLNVGRGIEVLEGTDVSMNGIIARANRIATQERWNVPKVPESEPSVINIQVTTEMGEDKAGYDKNLRRTTRQPQDTSVSFMNLGDTM